MSSFASSSDSGSDGGEAALLIREERILPASSAAPSSEDGPPAPAPTALWITFNAPGKKNPLRQQEYFALAAALRDADASPAVAAVVLTGAGDTFSAGAHLGELPDPELKAFSAFTDALLDCRKVVIAAVNGPAIGIACTALAHCDIVVAATSATFATPFLRIAVTPEFASSYTLPAILGPALAADMLLAGRTLSAAEALAGGLVAAVVRPEELRPAVHARLAAMLAPPHARASLLLFKRLMRQWREAGVREAHRVERGELSARLASGVPFEAVVALRAAMAAEAEGRRERARL
jgi:enoyl-CoA hydratase/carnithine racemase